MVDQRVSEGPRALFFNKPAHTTTIPAQLVLKYNCKLYLIYGIFTLSSFKIFFNITNR